MSTSYEHILEFNANTEIHPCFIGVFEENDLDERALKAANGGMNFHEIDLTIPQMEFYLLENKYPLFVAGMGSGKSVTLAICAVRDLVNFPGADIAVYAPTFDLLKLIVVSAHIVTSLILSKKKKQKRHGKKLSPEIVKKYM